MCVFEFDHVTSYTSLIIHAFHFHMIHGELVDGKMVVSQTNLYTNTLQQIQNTVKNHMIATHIECEGGN